MSSTASVSISNLHSHGWARHANAHADLIGGIRNRPKHAPYERAMALLGDPRMKMIRDRDEIEPGLLGDNGQFDEFGRRVRYLSRVGIRWVTASIRGQT